MNKFIIFLFEDFFKLFCDFDKHFWIIKNNDNGESWFRCQVCKQEENFDQYDYDLYYLYQLPEWVVIKDRFKWRVIN